MKVKWSWYEESRAFLALGAGRYIYYTFIYRHHMRWLHKRGKHRLKVRPLDGLLECSWCGYLQTPDGGMARAGVSWNDKGEMMMGDQVISGPLSRKEKE